MNIALSRQARRAFSSSARKFQAVPTQKPVLEKEFKIYRWVIHFLPPRFLLTVLQNPDEPATKPTLQSYKIDLNQTGPMVRKAFGP
jgi:succinate dehydrogenase (ubiquinone) iron-sulfur subunit